MATGGANDPITGSNININGSNLEVANNALFQADNDFNVNGVAQKSNTRSTNKSSSAAIGGYIASNPNQAQGPNGGITATASKSKGYANSDSVTYANSQINVGGTTTLDIGNDLNLKGGVLDTDKIQGAIGGDVNIESLQDTYSYDSNQKNAGFTLDVDILGNGAGSSLSVNGGKKDVTADYKAVGQQSGIFTGDGGFDLTVDGKTTLIGGAITTTDAAVAAGLNNYVSKGGIVTQDIENTTSYEGDAIQVGVSLGMTENKPQANTNGLGYGTDSNSDSSTTRAGITGIAGNSGITTDNQAEYAGALDNVFNETRVNEELGAQVEITQAFDQERRKIKTELNQDEEKYRKAAKEAIENGDRDAWEAYSQEADKIQQKALIFDGISGALYGPNTNGAVGYIAKAISPQIAYQIGQAFKGSDFENSKNGNNELAGVGSPQHLLAHLILGAAVSYATGNDALIGGASAAVGEGQALLLSKYLYDTKDPSQLTAEQKDVISSIASLTGLAIGATTGNVTDAVNAGETALVAVQDNGLENVLLPHEIEEITNVWGTETRPITKKDFDKLVKSMSATLGFDVEDAAIHIFRPLLDSPVGVAAGLTVKITSSGIKITSKSGKVTSYTAKELAQLNASRVASKSAASDIPSASIGSNLPVRQGTPIKQTVNKLSPIKLTFDKITRTWTSPKGLDYGQGSKQGNRVKHVLEHASSNPNKLSHTVFDVPRNHVLSLVDEAWNVKGSPLVNDPGAYVVNMNKIIGTNGETSIKIIVRPGTNQIITAYPIP